MKRLLYSTWRWETAVKLAFGMAENPDVWRGRYKIESSRTGLEHETLWRWHVYRVR